MTKNCSYIKEDGSLCGAYPMKDNMFCYQHGAPEEERLAAASKGGKGSRYRRVKPIHPDDVDITPTEMDAWIVQQLRMVVDNLNEMHNSPEVMRATTSALEALDRALERQNKRQSHVMEIEVSYVNDWREGKDQLSR